MELGKLMELVDAMKKGAYARIEYRTELPVKAAYKKAGVKVVKTTETTTRFGIDYSNIQSVIDRRAVEGKADYDCPYTYVNDYIVQSKKDPSKYYLNIFTVPNANSKSVLRVDDQQITWDDAKEYVIPSYFKDPKEPYVPSEIKRVNITNIISIQAKNLG